MSLSLTLSLSDFVLASCLSLTLSLALSLTLALTLSLSLCDFVLASGECGSKGLQLRLHLWPSFSRSSILVSPFP